MLGGEEIEPVAAVRRREEVILDSDYDEEPKYYLAPEERCVEGGHLARGLTVVFWEADEENNAYCPHEGCDDKADDADDGRIRG